MACVQPVVAGRNPHALFAQYLNERKAYVKAKPEEFKPNGEMIRQYMNKRNYRYSSFDEWVAETFLDHSRRRMALVDNALRRGVMDAFLLFVDKVRAYLVDAIGYDRTAKVFDDFLRGQYWRLMLALRWSRGQFGVRRSEKR